MNDILPRVRETVNDDKEGVALLLLLQNADSGSVHSLPVDVRLRSLTDQDLPCMSGQCFLLTFHRVAERCERLDLQHCCSKPFQVKLNKGGNFPSQIVSS